MIELPIFYFTDEQQDAVTAYEKYGGNQKPEYDYSEYEVHNCLFPDQIVITPYDHNDHNGEYIYTKIFFGSEYWICQLSYEQAKEKISYYRTNSTQGDPAAAHFTP